MNATKNVRTMEFIDLDFWSRPVYKCIENGNLWKDVALGDSEEPDLYSSSNNEMDGEPCSPIAKDLIVVYKQKYKKNPYRFDYMMLSRLKMDCEYYLGYGGRNEKYLSHGNNVKDHIERMKEIHNAFPEEDKPEWLTYEEILEYEKQMSEEA